ncbi:hypothetical protein KIPE111705_36275 [Kibdelosporangium persicum]|uniref:Uncharacterized protein n=1 Tax=Kibdelosporangium persicum TaxID=2698649 RepID=A0ABX2F4G7_9PSEU|nr:hypothetical protein [Kibdelosporangium persicum]NRN66216.1 hypothetical protein [Kibdelosporangium persicum]
MRKIEFAELGSGPVADGNGVRITGRCYKGPVRVGDFFTEARGGGGKHDIALKVSAIVYHGEFLAEMVKGQSADIVLAGHGFERVTSGVRLRGLMP